MELIDAKVEFRDFFILLSRNPWFNKIANFHDLQKVVKTCNKTDDNKWEYNLVKFEFKNINIDRHIRPTKVNNIAKSGDGTAKVLLSVYCCCNSSNDIDENEDPIINLATKINIQFEFLDDEKADDCKILQSSWHLDKQGAGKKVNSSHPLYHYEFGGTEITKDNEFNFGDFFLIDAPRIMHPPLDIVLAMDFVIKNYYKVEDHSALTNQEKYRQYIKNAQIRLWRPYALSLASNFYDFAGTIKINSGYAKNILHCD